MDKKVLIPAATVGVGACLSLAYYLAFTRPSSAEDEEPQATYDTDDFKASHVVVPTPGGFDHLHLRKLTYATCGANMTFSNYRSLKFALPDEPKQAEIDELKALNLGAECFVLVAVDFAGINYADCIVRWGLYSSANKYVGNGITPGFEFSGTVVKVIGKQTDKSLVKFNPGDKVFGFSMFGAYTTRIIVPNTQVFKVPKNIKMSEIAGFPVTGITAYYSLFQLGMPRALPHVRECVNNHMKSGFKSDSDDVSARPPICVLVHSASGGVGSMLVQMCKKVAKFDCVVGIVGGKHKIPFAKEMGCDIVVDRKDIANLVNGNIWDELEFKYQIKSKYNGGFDLVFDANGVATLGKSYQFLKPTGKVITYGFSTSLPHSGKITPFGFLKVIYNTVKTPKFDALKMVNQNKGVEGFNLSFLFSRTDITNEFMSNAIPWIENGDIKMSQVTVYNLEDVATAHRDIQTGNTVGKLVLKTPSATKE